MPVDRALQAVLAGAVPFALPLRRSFRSTTVREGVLIEGPSGWGEFAPFDDYTDAAAARWLDSAIEAAYGRYPDRLRELVPVNAIIPGVAAADAVRLTEQAVLEHGCRTVKVKVGSASLDEDEARVASVRDALDAALGPGAGTLRVDANGAWDVPAAIVALRRLSPYGLEYAEQPCRSAAELRALRGQVDVPIAVDESIRGAADPATVRVREFADIAVLKAAPLGGVTAAMRVVEALDLPVVVSGSLDSSVGLDAGIALAAALPDLRFACGLGTGALLAADVVAAPRVPIAGLLPVQRTRPDVDALLAARERLTDNQVDRWRARLAAAWQAGAGERSRSLVVGAA